VAPVDGARTRTKKHPRGDLIIDSGVDTAFVRGRIAAAQGAEAAERIEPGRLMEPSSIAEAYWTLHQQSRDAGPRNSTCDPMRKLGGP